MKGSLFRRDERFGKDATIHSVEILKLFVVVNMEWEYKTLDVKIAYLQEGISRDWKVVEAKEKCMAYKLL